MRTVCDEARGRPAGRSRRAAPLVAVSVLVLLVELVVPVHVARAAPSNPSNAQIRAAEQRRRADVVALGKAAGRIAALEGEIQRTQDALEVAVATYNATTERLQQATAEVTRTGRAQLAARAAVDAVRDQARVQIRQAYIRGPMMSVSAFALSRDPSALMTAYALRRYLAVRSKNAVTTLSVAEVAVSNADAAARLAEQRARDLQAEAARQKDAVIASLRTAQQRKVAMAAQRRALDRQAALAYGRLKKLHTARAAYLAWQAEARRKRAAEAARQAALQRQREAAAQREATRRAAQNQAPPPSGVGRPMSSPVLPPQSGGVWGNPMAPGAYSVSSCFCARWGTFHYGVDFAAPLGTPIHAIGAGTVAAAGPAQGFGNWVVIDHGEGSFSVYGHMRIFDVQSGQRVQRGQVIAYIGTEGESTGPHLHLEIRLGGIEGTKVDPEVWLAQRGVYIQ